MQLSYWSRSSSSLLLSSPFLPPPPHQQQQLNSNSVAISSFKTTLNRSLNYHLAITPLCTTSTTPAVEMAAEDPRIAGIASSIRVIPDFPKPGIIFQDITTLLLDTKAFKDTIDLFVERYTGKGISVVAGVEARGFIFGPPIALAIGAKFVPLRKPKKLPGEVVSQEYSLEYGTDKIEMHVGAVQEGERALVIDDLIATGGTLGAAIKLLERVGANVVECACVIELPELQGRVKLGDKPLFVLLGAIQLPLMRGGRGSDIEILATHLRLSRLRPWKNKSGYERIPNEKNDIPSDGGPRGPLWRGKKLIGNEALFVIMGLKRFKDDDEEKLQKFIKTHLLRLLKMDMIAVLTELERQEETTLAVKEKLFVEISDYQVFDKMLHCNVYCLKMYVQLLGETSDYEVFDKIFEVIQKQDWYEPDVFVYKDLIISLARCKKMDEAMRLWENMRKEELFPDSQSYTEVIRGFLRDGSPGDAMNIYEDMLKSPDPPEELPFRILLKRLLPHPLLRNKVKKDFEELFPEKHAYDPPEEIFGRF
ncbi:hypothetical protein ACFE04_006681 [Oxalis oulophora]